MLLYIIDAFNLVHKVPQLKRSSSPRADLLDFIRKNNLSGSDKNRVIVVFDGFPVAEPLNRGSFKIIYSQELTADDIIKKQIDALEESPDSLPLSEVVVVTDDRQIRDYAKSKKARLSSTADFLLPLERVKTGKKHQRADEEKDIDYSTQREITEEMKKIWLGKPERD